jgi:hypothetical protein
MESAVSPRRIQGEEVMGRITDLERFALEEIWRPYQNIAGYEDGLKALPKSIDETAQMLALDTEWSRRVLSRIAAIGFSFPGYIRHLLVDVVRRAQSEDARKKGE